MERILRQHARGAFESFTRHEALAVARTGLGQTDPRRGAPAANVPASKSARERYLLEQLAQFSSRHFEELRGLRALDAERDRERRSLAWCAQLSSASEIQLRNLPEQETRTGGNQQPAGWFAKELREGTWDPGKHPRGGYPQNRGWWSPAGGEGSGGTINRTRDEDDIDASGGVGAPSGELYAAAPKRGGGRRARSRSPEVRYDPAEDAYLPSKEKGTWKGKAGEGTFRLKSRLPGFDGPIDKIEFKSGFPVLEPFKSGELPAVILSGDRATDIANAEEAWLKLNPGKDFPKNATFHHDVLHVVETVVDIDGKKTPSWLGSCTWFRQSCIRKSLIKGLRASEQGITERRESTSKS